MSDAEGVIARIKARLLALLPTDWAGRAGGRFRKSMRGIADYAESDLHVSERAREAPDLAWTAVEGLASEKHARALLDYARGENERIDQELKRRTLHSKIRQEEATAAKVEAEARIAEINEIRARLDLIKELRAIGAVPILDSGQKIKIATAPKGFDWLALTQHAVPPPEQLLAVLVDVPMPSLGNDEARIELVRWLKQVGDAVEADEPIFEISTEMVDSEIPCPCSGEIGRAHV